MAPGGRRRRPDLCQGFPEFTGSAPIRVRWGHGRVRRAARLTRVFTFRRPKVRLEVPRLKPRGEAVQLPRVNLAELTPALLPYLGQAAYIQLSLFESLSRIVTQAPTVAHKESLGPAAGQALDKHERLVAEIRRHVDDPAVIMQPFAAAIDDYREVVAGGTWSEALTSLYVSAGILDDFFIHLAAGLENGSGPRMVQILDAESGRQAIATILADNIAADPKLASQLAMWGRRVVGDTLLVARSAIHHTDNRNSDEQRIEPVFTEVIASHTRRMDGLGLTA